MMDVAALVSLFVEVFGASKGWSKPKVVPFEHLHDAFEEKVVRDLKAKGHDFSWARETKWRKLERNGWEPVIERDKVGRPSIFVDRFEKVVLLHRPPDETHKA
jgi:hypothetical protein